MLDRVAQAQGALSGHTVGGAVTYLGSTWVQRIQGLAAFAILLRFRWWLPFVVTAGHAVSFSWRRRHWVEMSKVAFSHTDALRRADYLRRLATRPEAAKETQVFSLAGWLVDRYRVDFLDTMRPIWRERRSGASPAVGVTVLLLVLEGFALLLVARAGTSGDDRAGRRRRVRPGRARHVDPRSVRHGQRAGRGRHGLVARAAQPGGGRSPRPSPPWAGTCRPTGSPNGSSGSRA